MIAVSIFVLWFGRLLLRLTSVRILIILVVWLYEYECVRFTFYVWLYADILDLKPMYRPAKGSGRMSGVGLLGVSGIEEFCAMVV